MTAINTGNFLTKEDVHDIVGAVEKGSVFMGIAKEVKIGHDGLVLQSMGQELAAFVGEGGVKPVINPSFSEFRMKPFKLARIVYSTEEALRETGALANLLLTEAAGSLARTFDAAILGAVASRPVGFDTLVDITDLPLVITGYPSFVLATAPKGGYAPSHIVLNHALKTQLMMIVNDHQAPILVITDSTINGVPYRIVEFPGQVTPFGYVGPFSERLLWGVVPGTVSARQSNEATILDNGVLVNLWQENKVAFLVEAEFACKAYDLNGEFSKLATA